MKTPDWTPEELAYGEGWRRGYAWGLLKGALVSLALYLFVSWTILSILEGVK